MDNQTQEIKLKSDGSCLDITDWSKDNGANIYIYTCHPDNQPQNQQVQLSAFVFADSLVYCIQWSYDSTTHTITSKLDGKCVDGSEYGTNDGTNVQVSQHASS